MTAGRRRSIVVAGCSLVACAGIISAVLVGRELRRILELSDVRSLPLDARPGEHLLKISIPPQLDGFRMWLARRNEPRTPVVLTEDQRAALGWRVLSPPMDIHFHSRQCWHPPPQNQELLQGGPLAASGPIELQYVVSKDAVHWIEGKQLSVAGPWWSEGKIRTWKIWRSACFILSSAASVVSLLVIVVTLARRPGPRA